MALTPAEKFALWKQLRGEAKTLVTDLQAKRLAVGQAEAAFEAAKVAYQAAADLYVAKKNEIDALDD